MTGRLREVGLEEVGLHERRLVGDAGLLRRSASRARPCPGCIRCPWRVAPRLAAVMTVRPSPEPRSITKSCGVTFAMSSILSTSACGVGTQTTSLPSWPTCGSIGLLGCPGLLGGRGGLGERLTAAEPEGDTENERTSDGPLIHGCVSPAEKCRERSARPTKISAPLRTLNLRFAKVSATAPASATACGSGRARALHGGECIRRAIRRDSTHCFTARA